MNRLFGLLAGEVVNYISHRSETNYLVDKLGCKKTTQELCAQLRVYQNDVAPAPRLEDLIRYHFKPCDPSCEYYVSLENAIPSLCHGIIEYGSLLTCRALYAVVLYHTLHNRYPD